MTSGMYGIRREVEVEARVYRPSREEIGFVRFVTRRRRHGVGGSGGGESCVEDPRSSVRGAQNLVLMRKRLETITALKLFGCCGVVQIFCVLYACACVYSSSLSLSLSISLRSRYSSAYSRVSGFLKNILRTRPEGPRVPPFAVRCV